MVKSLKATSLLLDQESIAGDNIFDGIFVSVDFVVLKPVYWPAFFEKRLVLVDFFLMVESRDGGVKEGLTIKCGWRNDVKRS